MDILVPPGVETAVFLVIVAPRVFVDHPVVFPVVVHILDVTLKLVDPQNQVLVKYLASIDSSNLIGVLPPNRVEGTSKATKVPKKKKQVEKQPNMEEEVVKETIP